MTKVGILGYYGRMGQAIAAEVAAHKECTLAGGAVLEINPQFKNPDNTVISEKVEEIMALSDVMIDFTFAVATIGNIKLATNNKKPMVVGTTGITPEALDALKEAAKKIPVLYASNTSLSLAAMKKVTVLAAKLLADFDYDVAILDEHHNQKKDAPSGTAKTLGEAVLQGNAGKKQPSYAAIRAGHIIGNHEVMFTGNGETIRIHHSVTDRAIFARGAVQAALWLAKKPAGFYGMDDVLGFKA
ncbi:MAG: 4-hydroxy-tetrahydrodipicolinate reductase [Alphaproteobacteria bacterium]